MPEERVVWKNVLIVMAAAALILIGLGIIIYVSIARDRIAPTPTAIPLPSPTEIQPTATALPTATLEPQGSVQVAGTVVEYSAGALIIIIAPDVGDIEQIIVPENVVVVNGGGRRASPAEIVPGQHIVADGELDALGRLVAAQILLDGEPPEATPVPEITRQPTATEPAVPTLTPTAVQGWLGEYFDNPDLKGQPVLARADQTLDFDWGAGSPAPQVPADGFSVRWHGSWAFDEGGYRLYAYTDDGVRVWMDGDLLIDQWHNQPATLHASELYIPAGEHEMLVEYFERETDAQVRVWWDYLGAYPDWRGEYFDNANLQGDPALVRNDAQLSFNWGGGSPGEGLPPDRFSARWLRQAQFSEDAYRFMARGDDGIRVWVDGLLIIDHWDASTADTYVGHIWLDEGPHEVRVEYYEDAGDATIDVWWETIDSFSHWQAEYYGNPDLKGRPAFVRDDALIDFNWGESSPGSGVPIDNFSVRWIQNVTFTGATYRFKAEVDDGVRVYVDGQLLIDEWNDAPLGQYQADIALTSGDHLVEVAYYERGGQAIARVNWAEAPTPTPTMTLTPTETPTQVPPTAEPTGTPVPPTATSAPPTAEPEATATETPVPTEAPPTAETTATLTPEPPTATPTEVAPTPTNTTVPEAYPTPCETCQAERPAE